MPNLSMQAPQPLMSPQLAVSRYRKRESDLQMQCGNFGSARKILNQVNEYRILCYIVLTISQVPIVCPSGALISTTFLDDFLLVISQRI